MHRINTLILAFLINVLIFTPATPATLGYQIDMLLSQVRTTAGGAITAGHVHFYEAGSTTDKTIWTTVNKTTSAANPYNLDANGTAYVFGDGLYRIVVHSAPDTTSPLGVVTHGPTAYDRDNVRYEDYGSAVARFTSLAGDNTGTLSGFTSITGPGTGNISGFVNGTFTGRVTSDTATITTDNITTANITALNVTGTPTFVDNIINGVDLIDNTVTSAKMVDSTIANDKIMDNTINPATKLAHTGTPDNTTFLRGDNKYQPILNLCNLSKNDNQATGVYSGDSVAVNWDVEDSDTIGCHTGSDNTITTPAGFTYINIVTNVHFAAGADTRYVRVYQNGAIIVWHAYYNQAAGNTSNGLVSTGWIPCAEGDTFQVHAHSSSSNPDIDGSRTWFKAEFK